MANNYSNIYSIKDFILNDITPKYFNTDDISLNNVGLYGLINDISSTVAEDTMRVTSRYITEIIPGQSRLPEFIYSNAANYGINDIFSTCAHCKAMLFIKESDVINNGVIDGRYREYTIDSDLLIYIDDIPFSIPSDIKIKSTYYNGNYNHRCYWTNPFVNSIVDNDLPYIKCAKTRIQDETEPYLVLALTLYQYERKRTTESIILNTVLNIPYIDVSFDDSLCNFEVLYTSNDGTVTQLNKILNNAAPLTSPFIYYSMQDENTLRISFSNDDRYFVPSYGSSIEILRYETLGEKGNFPLYTGDNIYVTPKSENEAWQYNNNIPLFCVMTSESRYGKDEYSLDDLKLLTNRYQKTVNSITTDNDLMTYFETYTGIYKTVAKIIKVRDDFANRMYACYTRLRDDDNIYPTNTVNLQLSLLDLTIPYNPDHDMISIPAGIKIAYTENSVDDCHIVDKDDDSSDVYYSTLGLTVIDKVDNNVSLYMTSIDTDIPVLYEFVHDTSIFQFIVKKLSISRNSINDDTGYKITIDIIPTDLSLMDTVLPPLDEYAGSTEEDNTSTNQDKTVLDLSKLKLFLFVETLGGHYIEMDYINDLDSSSDTGYKFTCNIETNDYVNSKNICLTNLTHCTSQQTEECYTAMQNPPIKILVAYDEGYTTKQDHKYSELIPDIANYTLCNIFKPESDSVYFAYPLELVRPVLEFIPDSESEYGFSIYITSLPVVGYDFIKEDNNLNNFLTRLNTQHDYLQDSLITSNFGIYMRFFNTYGRSRTFNVTTGDLLNRVNCSLSLSIKFFDGVEVESYLTEIKMAIKEYIESVNASIDDVTSGINSIKLSLISTLIHEKFGSIVNFVVMGSINGYNSDVQTIVMNKDLTDKTNMELYPEFLTIDIKDISITVL